MRRTCFPSVLRRSLTMVALAIALISVAWAQPKFKILATVPGGLFTGLTFDAKGNLYGGTGGGGDHNDGTIFELTPGAHGWTLTTLHSFDGQDGGSPNGDLIFDAVGNLYGTASVGGTGFDGGTIFEMTPGSGGWIFNVVYDFCQQYHCPDGGAPTPVVLDGEGGLCGAIAAGGVYGRGGVFRLTPGSGGWSESVLYSYGARPYDAYIPYAPPIFDKAGNIYGTTYYGGVDRLGTVYRLKHSSSGWTERLLRQFDGADGALAAYGLVFDSSGSLYGTTVGGGPKSLGTVFKLTPGPKGGGRGPSFMGFLNQRTAVTPAAA